VSNTVDERRQHQRRDTVLSMQGTSDEGAVVARMTAKNLSVGGLYCTSSKDFPEMTRLAVRLMLPDPAATAGTEPLDLEAVVVRRQELAPGSNGDDRFELALFFPTLGQAAKQRLESFLETV
jgi:hypothetical protein